MLASRYVKNHVDLKSFFYCFIFKRSLQEKKKESERKNKQNKKIVCRKKRKGSDDDESGEVPGRAVM